MGGGHRPSPVSGQPNRAMRVKFGSGLSATIIVPNAAEGNRTAAVGGPTTRAISSTNWLDRLQPHKRCPMAWCS